MDIMNIYSQLFIYVYIISSDVAKSTAKKWPNGQIITLHTINRNKTVTNNIIITILWDRDWMEANK